MRSLNYCLLWLVFCTPLMASGTSMPIVRLAAEDSWAPYSDVRGQGLSNRLVKAAFAAVGYEAKISVMPYARVEHQVLSGVSHGGFNVTRQASTENLFLFGNEPLLSAPASFFFSKQQGQHFESYDTLPDGVKIGLIIGYEYGDIYQVNQHRFTETRVSHQHQLIRMLLAGRVDAVIMFDEVAKYTLKKMHLSGNDLQKGFQNHVSDIYVAFSPKYPSAQYLSERLDKGLRLLKERGEYQQMFAEALTQ